MAFFQR